MWFSDDFYYRLYVSASMYSTVLVLVQYITQNIDRDIFLVILSREKFFLTRTFVFFIKT